MAVRPDATISVFSAAERICGDWRRASHIPFQREAGPCRRQAAFVEATAPPARRSGCRGRRRRAPSTSQSVRRVAGSAQPSASSCRPPRRAPAARSAASACAISTSSMMAISAMARARRRRASHWRSGTGRRRGCRSSGSGRRRAAPAVTKLPIDSTKTKTAPAAMPGTVSGRMTRRKVVAAEAPRSREASASSGLSRDSGA